MARNPIALLCLLVGLSNFVQGELLRTWTAVSIGEGIRGQALSTALLHGASDRLHGHQLFRAGLAAFQMLPHLLLRVLR
jgi:hypothetical protein